MIGAQAEMKMELKNPTHNWKTQRKPLQYRMNLAEDRVLGLKDKLEDVSQKTRNIKKFKRQEGNIQEVLNTMVKKKLQITDINERIKFCAHGID